MGCMRSVCGQCARLKTSAAYTAAINGYLRKELKYGTQETYKPGAYTDASFTWDFRHQIPGGPPR